MSFRILHPVRGRLSLRTPQAESLARLKRVLDAASEMPGHERDVASILSIGHHSPFSSVRFKCDPPTLAKTSMI
jgi:hypothetical protein